ncbi:MAG: 1-acyl-sn-glycerol-3-phosphate acyltransferase [Rhodothermales bacterium]|nr:1-acyl-sn-glycerol-3-phosphate acyltransferase [Rhodothermales bacterium]
MRFRTPPTIPSVAAFRASMTPLARLLWRPRLEGLEHFPKKGPCFIYGNHSNRWDPFIINCFMPWLTPTAGVMTKEYFRSRITGGLFNGVGILPASKGLAEPFLVRRVLELLRQDRAIVIFPEGSARWEGTPMQWMPSTVKMFVRAGVPIHPIRIHGSYMAFPRWADYPRKSRVTVEALPPISMDRKTDVAVATETFRALTDFDETSTREECVPTRGYKLASGIRRLLYRDPWDDSGPCVASSKDGRLVTTHAGRRLSMQLDSRLRDESDGTLYTTAELYERIRFMPLVQTQGGAILDDVVLVHTESAFPNLREIGMRRVRLHADHISIDAGQAGGGQAMTIDMEKLVYCDVERNFKLQFYLQNAPDSLVQFSFVEHGSALQWKDALQRLCPEVVGSKSLVALDLPDIRPDAHEHNAPSGDKSENHQQSTTGDVS